MTHQPRNAPAGPAEGEADDGPESLEDVLDQLETCAADGNETSVGDVTQATGTRGFAPLILIAGLIMLAPGIGDIPGVPTMMGMIVILVVVQMLMGRRHIWLPGWLSRRSVRNDRLRKTVGWLRKPARLVDRWLRPRYVWAVRHGGFVVVAVACIVVAMATPIMEVVPFSANLAGIVITAFGLAMLASDGLVALVAVAVAVGTGVLLTYNFVAG